MHWIGAEDARFGLVDELGGCTFWNLFIGKVLKIYCLNTEKLYNWNDIYLNFVQTWKL